MRVYSVPRSLFYDDLEKKAAAPLANQQLLKRQRANVVARLIEQFDPNEVYEAWVSERLEKAKVAAERRAMKRSAATSSTTAKRRGTIVAS